MFINLSVEKKYFYKISIFYCSYSDFFDANSTGPVLSEGKKYLDKISIFFILFLIVFDADSTGPVSREGGLGGGSAPVATLEPAGSVSATSLAV